MLYKIRSSLIPVPESHRQPMLATLAMYDRGEDISNSPLVQSKVNLTHMEVYKAIQRGVPPADALRKRQEAFIKLYEDIKANGYNGSAFWCWFDDDGFIRIYDGFHRLPILEHLGLDIEVPVETSWAGGVNGQHKGRDFPLAEVLWNEHPKGSWLYQPVNNEKVSGWSLDRRDSPQRLQHILQGLVGETVLDIGCSEGYFSREIAKKGYKVTSIDKQHGFIAAARYLSTLEGVSVDYHETGDWKDFLGRNGPYDNILFLSVIHNDMKIIGVDAGLRKLEAFRGKAKRVFLETPQEKGEREWMVPGFPQFNFFEEGSMKKVEDAMEMKATEMWSIRSGSRPIYTLDNEEIPDSKLDEGGLVRTDVKSGFSLYLFKDEPILTPTILQTHEWEVDVTRFIRENLKEGQTFVDVGAYVGYYSILASGIVGDKGKVYAFEPSPDSYQVLLANIELNKCKNITPVNKALSDVNGQSRLLSYASSRYNAWRGLASVDEREPGLKEKRLTWYGLPANYPLRESAWTLVDTVRLDTALTESPDLIKVDVDGGEKQVLEGATKLLENRDLKLIIEEVRHRDTSSWLVKERGFTVIEHSRGNCLLGATPALTQQPVALRIIGSNFGDLLNIPILTHYFGEDLQFLTYKEIKPKSKVLVGAGTLIGYTMPTEWYLDRDIIFLGTGSRNEEEKVNIPAKGFTRGKLTEGKTGIKALGDIVLLIDRVYGVPDTKRDRTGIVLDKTDKEIQVDLPNPDRFTAHGLSVAQLPEVYNRIAGCRYVITDRLHVAVVAESLHIPWILWNHGDKTLSRTPHKFMDWAGMIGKERFVIEDIANHVVIKENTDFNASEKQKDILEAAIQEIAQASKPHEHEAKLHWWSPESWLVPKRIHEKPLTDTLRSQPCRNIMEIGVHLGNNAVVMIKAAAQKAPEEEIHYYGFDLFEERMPSQAKEEFSPISAPMMEGVMTHIKRNVKAQVTLIKGDTKKTLEEAVKTLPKMDLIYIDGGHSIATTRNDWEYASKLMHKDTVVYFDDYNDEMPFIGANFIVDELSSKYAAKVMPEVNYYTRKFGRFKSQLLKVQLKPAKVAKRTTDYFRFHLMSLPHSKTVKDWGPCAFTQLSYRFSQMLKDMGHEVYHYGTEGSDVACTEHIDVLTKAVQKQAYGDWDPWKQLWIHNGKDLAYTTFRKNAITELNRRKEPGDILLISNGNWLREIADVAGGGMITVEPFVGYLGFFAKYKVFPSYAWMHHMYGKISRTSMKENFTTGNWYDAVIPHFFDPDDHTFEEKKEDYFLYIGRLIQRKGIHIAVDLCRRIGAKLVVGGQPLYPEPPDKREWSLNSVGVRQPHVEYVGVPSFEEADKLRGKAKAVIIPSLYMEPFGLVVVEALLSGTPVITTDWGAFPEIVKQGEVGYRCRTMDDFIWAANNVDKIDPAYCREYAIKNYSMERISKAYQEYFTKVHDLFGKGWYQEHPERNNLDWLRRY